MPLVEVYNIENYKGADSSWISDIAVGALTTALGFILGLLPGLVSRHRTVTKTGELFKYELNAIEPSLRSQIDFLMQYIKDFLAKDPKKANLLTLTFTLLHKFDFIKSLDKVTIIKYYERKHKQRATNWIGEAYQVIGVVETEVRRTEAYFEERQAEIKKLTDSYIVLFNDLKALAVRERDRIGNFNGWQNDKFLAALWEVAFNGNRNLSTSQIIALADTLHIQLQDGIFSDVKHVLYEPTLKFNLNGRFLIGQMQTLNQLYMNHLKGVTAQFTEAYRFLYLGEFNYLGENKLNKKD